MRYAHRHLAVVFTMYGFGVLPLTSAGQAPSPDQMPPSKPGISSAEYAQRRQKLRELMRADGPSERPRLALLRGGDWGDNQDYEEGRFYQEANFHYLTGVSQPGAFLLIDANQDRDTLFLPDPRTTGQPQAQAWGFDEVAPTSQLFGRLFSLLDSPPRRRGRFFASTGAQLRLLNPQPADDNPGREARLVRWLREGAPTAQYADLRPLLARLRKHKSPSEIALLQRAIDITADAQRAVAQTLRPGIHEYTLEGAIAQAFLAGGALRPGFASIVGSGPNACIPHYFQNDRQIEAGDLVVVDIGAEFQGYTADITRTFPATGQFTDRQRALYQAVLDAQRHAEARFVPGTTRLREMTGWVRDFFRDYPLRGLAEDGTERTLDHFFIHGLSHYLGLDVHDVGDTSEPMQPGEVFTIEPGLYIPAERIGIRIEDDYLVTQSGLEKLSGDLPSDPDQVEALMKRPLPPATETGHPALPAPEAPAHLDHCGG
ncbi:MAG: Xaa-Pro aminopeptidase [Isosphaeraceae bacterium]|jgi:Xaa-Pro aminopeptidase|nr:MAG: Xaa-Pro aminopeptidase [Isosphaeraceae bacterium]